MSRSPSAVLAGAIRILDELGIAYLIGGSFASSAYGEARFTQDADVVIDLRPEQLEPLAARLESEFYVDRDAMREALSERRSFNAVHLDSAFKIDFFVLGRGLFDQEEFRRRALLQVPGLAGASLVFKTPEDTILRKLEWYRSGGEVSEQQWRDVLGVLNLSGDRLDQAYLDRWAATLRVTDLLHKARELARGA